MPKKTVPINEPVKVEVQYRKSLLVRTQWLKDHQDAIINLLKSNEDRYQTDAPASDLRAKINQLREMYRLRFTAAMTQRLAKRFFDRMNEYNKNKMKSAFNPLGIDLNETLKRENLTDFQSIAIQNQVDLIKSIESEYFDKIEKIVYNGMTTGQDWDTLAKQIRKATGATEKRSKLIAKDQVTTINSQLAKRRALNAGLTKCEWVKTKRFKTKNYNPRESHILADGKVFDINKGLKVDGKYIFPGSEINCSCVARYLLD